VLFAPQKEKRGKSPRCLRTSPPAATEGGPFCPRRHRARRQNKEALPLLSPAASVRQSTATHSLNAPFNKVAAAKGFTLNNGVIDAKTAEPAEITGNIEAIQRFGALPMTHD